MPAPRRAVPLPLSLATCALACLAAACGTTERDEYMYVRSLRVAPTPVGETDRLPPPVAARKAADRMAALVTPGSLTDGEPISP